MDWLKQNIFELLWAVIVVAILVYAIMAKDTVTIDKILLVALAIFKGVSIEITPIKKKNDVL